MDLFSYFLGSAGFSFDPASYFGFVIVVGVLSQFVAYKLKIPSILLLLLVGFGLGQIVKPDELIGRELLFAGVSLAVGIILFEGGLSLKFKELKKSGSGVFRLCSATWLLAWPLTVGLAWLLGFDLRLAALIGAILVVTGPTVVGPILRSMRPNPRVSSMVKWEGIVVDPIGAILAVLVFQAVLAGNAQDAILAVIWGLFITLVTGFGVALFLGWGLEQLMKKHLVPDFLHGVVFLAVAVGSFVLSNKIQPESGLLTVTVLGVWLANRKGFPLNHVIEFKEHLRTLFIGALFLILAGRIGGEQLLAVLPQALLFLVGLVFVIRPVSVFGGLLGSGVNYREQTLLAALAPRGIVAAAVTSIFALEFAHVAEEKRGQVKEALMADNVALADTLAASAESLEKLSKEAESMVPLVFLLIVGTVAIYGLGARVLARKMGLAQENPQGVLFAGSSAWAIQCAKLLKEMQFRVTIVDSNYRKLVAARMEGIPTVTANILSEYAIEELDFSGIGKMIAMTPNDEVNATAAREFVHHFGRSNVFQLARATGKEGKMRQKTVEHIDARSAFVPALSWAEMERKISRSWVVKRTTLSKSFPLQEFYRSNGEDAVVLFVVVEGKLAVACHRTKLPETEGTLIALVPKIEQNASS